MTPAQKRFLEQPPGGPEAASQVQIAAWIPGTFPQTAAPTRFGNQCISERDASEAIGSGGGPPAMASQRFPRVVSEGPPASD